MIKAIFFDLDDTLCDDSAAWLACARSAAQTAADHDARIDAEQLAQTFLDISMVYWKSIESVHESRPLSVVRASQWKSAIEKMLGTCTDALADEVAQEYGRRRSTEIEVFSDVFETLTALSERGLKLTLITNGLEITHAPKIVALGLSEHFDHIVIADTFGHFKPDVRIFEHALTLSKCRADEALMVGDDLVNDIGGASAAGVAAYWFNPSKKTLPPGSPVSPQGELHSIADLLAMLPGK